VYEGIVFGCGQQLGRALYGLAGLAVFLLVLGVVFGLADLSDRRRRRRWKGRRS
jgi:hypothetical protein